MQLRIGKAIRSYTLLGIVMLVDVQTRTNVKDTEDTGFLEKPRKFRDRTKKRRLTAEELKEKHDLHPKHQPYKRQKQWDKLLDEIDI